MPEPKRYYRILQVDPAAEPEVITAAYRRLALKYHPDSNQAPDALRRMQEINEAYEVLSDPVKREHYNLLLSAQPRSPSRPPVYDQSRARSRPDAAPHSRPETSRAEVDESTERSNQQLGCSFLVVYGVVVLLLFRLALTCITSVWVIAFVLILAGLITVPVVFKIDDYLRKQ